MSDKHEKRKVVLGVTGSIAAYKAAELARLMVTWGFEVRVVMTEAAQEFIAPLTFQAITGAAVTTSFWDDSEGQGIGHIQLADWADAVVVAPATADFIAKLACGFAESPLLAVALATKARVLVAPSMNVHMWQHPATVENLVRVKGRGVYVVDPGEGALACGWNGAGRLADPEEIFFHIRRIVSSPDFVGKRVVIATGPTREAIDPVRYLSNRSSGKMGVALAREAFRRGAEVTVVHGPVRVRVPREVRCRAVESAAQMHAVMIEEVYEGSHLPDVVIMAAAVSDYRVREIAPGKLKKGAGVPKIDLVENPDILGTLGQRRTARGRPLLIGFAVETGEPEDLLTYARGKIQEKGSDMIVANLAVEALEQDTNRVWILDRNGRQEEVALSYKSRVANKILDSILRL